MKKEIAQAHARNVDRGGTYVGDWNDCRKVGAYMNKVGIVTDIGLSNQILQLTTTYEERAKANRTT